MLFIVYAVYTFVTSGPQTVPTHPVVPVTSTPILNLPPSRLYFGPYCDKSLIDDSVYPLTKNGT